MPLVRGVSFGLYRGHRGRSRATPVSKAVHHSRPFHAAAAAVDTAAAGVAETAAAGTAAVAVHTAAPGVADTAAAGTAAAVGQILGSPIRSFGAVPSPCLHRHHPSPHVRRCQSALNAWAVDPTVPPQLCRRSCSANQLSSLLLSIVRGGGGAPRFFPGLRTVTSPRGSLFLQLLCRSLQQTGLLVQPCLH